MNKSHLKEIKTKLGSVAKHEKLLALLEGMSMFVFISAAMIFLVVMFEFIFEFGSEVRTILFIAILLILSGAFAYLIFPALIKLASKPNLFDAAQKVGDKHPEIKDELLNTLQLIEEKNSNYSESLIEAAFKRIYENTNSINFKNVINFNNINKQLGLSLFVFVILFIAILTFPGLRYSSLRIINFHKEYIPTPKLLFDVQPGNVSVTKGESVTITIEITGEKPGGITLYTKTVEQINFTSKRLIPDSLNMFLHKIKNIKSSFEYFVSANGIESERYKITVINRPVINRMEVTITPPAYSGIPPSFQKDNGNISTLAGSRLDFNIASTKPLENAYITFSDSTRQYFSLSNDEASLNIRAVKNLDYFISLIDKDGNANANPIQYTITTIADEYPAIEIINPEKDILLTSSNKINITTKINDDFGFTKLNLNYRLSASRYEEAWPQPKTKSITINTHATEDNIYYVWDLVRLVLAEGDAVTYYLEIFDNDVVNGPKSTKSEMLVVRVPSIDDLFGELDDRRDNVKDDLEKMFEEAKELQREFEKLGNELKQNAKDISWEEKEKLEKALERFEEMTGKTEEIKKQIAELQDDAMQNNLLSEETLEKYNELQNLLDELGSDEMREAFMRMQEMLKQLSRNQVQQSFEDMKANEKYFQKSIERTINLLKRIQIEQKVDELIKRTEELSKKIDDAINKTGENNVDNELSKELSQRQNDITDRINKIDELMNDLQSKMSELNDMPVDEMNKLMEEFQKQLNDELSKGAEQNLRMQQQASAMQKQQQLSQNMDTLSEMMQNLQQAIQQQNQMQVLYDMLKIIDNLLLISKEEEELKNKTEELFSFSTEYTNYAKRQNQLIGHLDKVTEQMAELSQKTFAITPEMGKAIGSARRQMQQSINQLQNRKSKSALQMQKQAMSYVNETALLMKSAMEMMMSGGQGGGMMSMMQQLQQMADRQMNLNQLTKMLNQGNLSSGQMAQLQRLANEQALIRKSLEQLNRESKEAGQSKKLAGNLDKILEEMNEVVSSLNSKNPDDELILKQERILSRLLDAQRSMTERDYDDKRESQTGTNITRQSPAEPDLSSQEGRDKLRDELIRALKEGYKKDYENLIRKYFEALQQEQNGN